MRIWRRTQNGGIWVLGNHTVNSSHHNNKKKTSCWVVGVVVSCYAHSSLTKLEFHFSIAVTDIHSSPALHLFKSSDNECDIHDTNSSWFMPINSRLQWYQCNKNLTSIRRWPCFFLVGSLSNISSHRFSNFTNYVVCNRNKLTLLETLMYLTY